MQIGLGVLVIVVGWSVWRFTNKGANRAEKEIKIAAKKHSDKKREGLDQFVEVDARIYDNTTRTIYNQTIDADIVRDIRAKYGNLGRTWLRDGKWVYALNKTDAGYKPVVVPMTLKDPPSELHRALQQHETGIVFNVEQPDSLFGKYGPYIWIGIIGVVAIFMLLADMRGG
jgi:hypothetical protein